MRRVTLAAAAALLSCARPELPPGRSPEATRVEPPAPVEPERVEPIAPVAAPAPRPISTLGVVRTIATDVGYLRIVGDRALFQAHGGVALVDRTGARTDHASGAIAMEYTDRFAADLVFARREGTLHALEPDGSLRWSAPIRTAPPLRPDQLRHVTVELAHDGGSVFASARSFALGDTADLRALDRRTGAERWRRQLAPAAACLASGGGRVVAVDVDRVVRAFDAADGRPLWTRPPRDGADASALVHVASLEDAVIVARDAGRIEILDGTTGRILRWFEAGGRLVPAMRWYIELEPLAIEAGVLYALVSRPAHGASEIVVRAIELASGASLWESPALPVPRADRAHLGPFFLDADAVHVCFGDAGTLRSFDRATGELRFEWGLGSCELAAFPADASGERVIVARRRDLSWVMLERGGAPPPLERVLVRGRALLPDGSALAGAPVVVHDTLARTDTEGRFDATVTARGSIWVSAREPEGLVGGSTTLELAPGTTERAVELRLTPPPPVD
jgi:hypothetical protein